MNTSSGPMWKKNNTIYTKFQSDKSKTNFIATFHDSFFSMQSDTRNHYQL